MFLEYIIIVSGRDTVQYLYLSPKQIIEYKVLLPHTTSTVSISLLGSYHKLLMWFFVKSVYIKYLLFDAILPFICNILSRVSADYAVFQGTLLIV